MTDAIVLAIRTMPEQGKAQDKINAHARTMAPTDRVAIVPTADLRQSPCLKADTDQTPGIAHPCRAFSGFGSLAHLPRSGDGTESISTKDQLLL